MKAYTKISMAMIVLAIAVACGNGNDSPTSPTPPNNGGGQGTTITIGPNGTVSPSTLTVSTGTRVTFVNNDSRSREIQDDPHPTHGSCPELQVGSLSPGQQKQSGALTRTCGWHDHNDPSVRGSIGIQ